MTKPIYIYINVYVIFRIWVSNFNQCYNFDYQIKHLILYFPDFKVMGEENDEEDFIDIDDTDIQPTPGALEGDASGSVSVSFGCDC